MSEWLEARAVLVTGGASGIGAAAAERFAQEGASVVVADMNGEAAERIASRIIDAGGRAVAVQADVSKELDNDRMVGACVTAFGRLDVAFLNAAMHGSYSKGGIPGLGDDDDVALFDRVVDTNLRGTYLGLRSVHRVIEQGGSVICTASLAGLMGYPDNPAYSVSKHGVLSLVKSFSHGFARKQVRINALCPGSVDTPMIGAQSDDPVGEPDDLSIPQFSASSSAQHIAEWAVFLSSPRSSGMNAATVPLDNGFTSCLPSSYDR